MLVYQQEPVKPVGRQATLEGLFNDFRHETLLKFNL